VSLTASTKPRAEGKANGSIGRAPLLVTSGTVVATLAVVVVYVLSDNGTVLEAAGAAAAACGMFAVGFGLVIFLERRLSRPSSLAVATAGAAGLRSTGLAQRSMSVREAVTPLLDEAALWISILGTSPPADWTEAVVIDQQDSLEEIRGTLVSSRDDDARVPYARERLAGYLTRLRRHYDGASAYEVQRQISG
jgi:hypothetical protein